MKRVPAALLAVLPVSQLLMEVGKGSALAGVQFVETEFSSYVVHPISVSGSAERRLDDGVPAPCVQVRTRSMVLEWTGVVLLFPHVYDISASGPIASIGLSFDGAVQYMESFGLAGIVVEQGGTVYGTTFNFADMGSGATGLPGFPANGTWESYGIGPLVEENFVALNQSDRPDFSATGAPIRLGVSVHSIGFPTSMNLAIVDFDNLTWTVVQVPAPGVSVALALGALAIARRPRRS